MTATADRWTVYVFAPAFELTGNRIVCTTGDLATLLLTRLDMAGLIGYGWTEPHQSGDHRPLVPEPAGIGYLMQAAQLAGIRWPADLCTDEQEEMASAPAGPKLQRTAYALGLLDEPPKTAPVIFAEAVRDALELLFRPFFRRR